MSAKQARRAILGVLALMLLSPLMLVPKRLETYKPKRSIKANNEGMADLSSLSIGVGMAALTIIIIMFVWAQIVSSLPGIPGNRGADNGSSDSAIRNSTANTYNTTLTTVNTNVGTAMTLLAVALIVGAATAIILIVVGAFQRPGGGGGAI